MNELQERADEAQAGQTLAAAHGSADFPAELRLPIRRGFTAVIALPRDLTQAEADRLCSAINLCVATSPNNADEPRH